MGFHKLYQGSLRSLNVSKISGSFTHIERIHGCGTIYRERKSFFFHLLTEFIHPVNIETQVDKARIAPNAAFENITGFAVNHLNQFHARRAKHWAKSPLGLYR